MTQEEIDAICDWMNDEENIQFLSPIGRELEQLGVLGILTFLMIWTIGWNLYDINLTTK